MPPFEIAWLWDVYILHAVYSTCVSSDAVVRVLQDQMKSGQISTLWVAMSNMRQRNMVLRQAAWLRMKQAHLQQQSYAMSVFATPTERGSLS